MGGFSQESLNIVLFFWFSRGFWQKRRTLVTGGIPGKSPEFLGCFLVSFGFLIFFFLLYFFFTNGDNRNLAQDFELLNSYLFNS